MGSFGGTCEIVEEKEELKTVTHSRRTYHPNSGFGAFDKDLEHPVLKLGYRGSLEDDINQLFESMSIKTSVKDLAASHHVGTSASTSSSPVRRNNMKRPMAVGVPPSPRSGTSASLKQALRDLCISKASEMAAVKRTPKSTASPRLSEAARITSLFNSVVVESAGAPGSSLDERKERKVEISILADESRAKSVKNIQQKLHVPKTKLSDQSSQLSPRFDVSATRHGTKSTFSQNGVVSGSRKAGNQALKVEILQKTNGSLPSVSHCNTDDEVLEPGKSVPSSTKSANRAAAAPEPKNKMHTVPSSSSSHSKKVENLTKSTPLVAKPMLKKKVFLKKKLKQSSVAAASPSNTFYEGDSIGILDANTNQLMCFRCHCALKNSSIEANLKHDSEIEAHLNGISELENNIDSKNGCEEASKDSIPANYASHTNEVVSSSVDVGVGKPEASPNTCKENSVLIKTLSNSKSKEKGEFSQSSKSSIGEHSSSTSTSGESSMSRSSCGNRPHMSKDVRWEAIRHVKMKYGVLGLRQFNLLKKLGCGDIGTVYLAELIGTNCLFAIKVMDNEFLARRKKMPRAQTEREILRMLDHPFLPTLYSQFTSDNLSCLVMEYCPGGDLHVLRQKQPNRCFSESAARFYIAEVLLALEYLHMLGVIYRDLKPENILVREDGHIMLTDFDLSLRCTVSPTLLKSSPSDEHARVSGTCSESGCINPFCNGPSCKVSCFTPKLPTTSKTRKLKGSRVDLTAHKLLPQLVAEPTHARSNSFVGTHEYLAPEIIKGEGHGAAVDWWTFGIFLYELIYGRTPFKGSGNEETIANVVLQNLKFPDGPIVSFQARELIRSLLVKEPENRLGSEKGAAEIKQHPFFQGLNWALIRCAIPPEVPELCEFGVPNMVSQENRSNYLECKAIGENLEFELF